MWTVLVGPLCTILGAALLALFQKFVRKTTKPQLEETLDAAFAKFKLGLIEDLNGTYVRSAGSNVTGAEIERRLKHLEAAPGGA